MSAHIDLADRPALSPISSVRVRKLDSVLENHARWEQRTLTDLANAGYKFATVDEARAYSQAVHMAQHLTEEQIVALVQHQLKGKGK